MALLLGLALYPAQRAQAATTCQATSTNLAFGPVTGAASVDATATVTVTCQTTALSLLAVARVRMCLNIGAGANGAGQTSPRRMTSAAGDAMQFQIFRDAARTQVWGDRTLPGTPTPAQFDLEYSVPLIGGSGTLTATLHGRVPAQAALAAGNYSNPFSGAHTRLEFRFAEAVLLAPPWPASCTAGGSPGASVAFPFTASASVPNRCTIAAAGNLGFGTRPGLIASPIDHSSTLDFTCTRRTPWNVSLDNGRNAAGGSRRMRLGTSNSYVRYELYRDPARSLRWGTTPGSDTASGTGTGAAQSLTVHGRVPGGQAVPAGNYSDVVTVTVTY